MSPLDEPNEPWRPLGLSRTLWLAVAWWVLLFLIGLVLLP